MIKINNNQNFASYDFVAPIQSVDTEIVSVNATEIVTVNAINIHPLQPTHLLYLPTNCHSEVNDDNNRTNMEENMNSTRTNHDDNYCCPPSLEAAQCYAKFCTFCVLSIFLFLFIVLVSFFSSRT